MSSKTIPAKTILTCDRCGDKGEKSQPGAFQYGGIHIKEAQEWARTVQGDVGGITYELDICQVCVRDFKKFMKRG